MRHKKPTLRKRHSHGRTVFKGTEICAVSLNTKGKRENSPFSLFWSQEELNDAFKKGCGGFKDGADTCLVEMMKDLDGEFKEKVPSELVLRSKSLKYELNNCALRTQEAEFKAGLCIPLAPASLIAAGVIWSCKSLPHFGIRVESERTCLTRLYSRMLIRCLNAAPM